MKRLTVIILTLFTALSFASGQNNPYGIDDTCFEYFQLAESLVGDTTTDAFEFANSALLKRAQEKGDEKARALHYVCKLKRTIRFAMEMKDKEAANDKVDQQRAETCAIAKETGYMQYYYYSFSLCQNYYINTQQEVHAQALLQNMMEISTKNGDEYGIWESNGYIATLYQRQNDLLNARKHLLRVLDIYENTSDEAILRQSVCSYCTNLANTYPCGSDSARFYYRRAEKGARIHIDTLRVNFYKAQLAALDGDARTYKRCKEACLNDYALPRLFASARCDIFFETVDAILEGKSVNEITALASKILTRQHLIYIRTLAIQQKREDVASWMGSVIIATLYADISLLNNIKMEELSTTVRHRQVTMELERQQRLNTLLIIALCLLAAGLIATLTDQFIANKKKKDIK